MKVSSIHAYLHSGVHTTIPWKISRAEKEVKRGQHRRYGTVDHYVDIHMSSKQGEAGGRARASDDPTSGIIYR